MKTFRIITVLFFTALSLNAMWAAAPAATIMDFKGKVEVLTNGVWEKAEKGMTIAPDQTISTGFNSWAILSLGASNVRIEPVSRLTLDQLADKGTTVKTDLYLRVGKVKADVKSTDGKKNDFSVASPYSTASVRGTSWTQSLRRVTVHDGAVAVRLGAPRRSQAGSGTGPGSTGEGESEGPGEGEPLGAGEGETLVIEGQSVDLPASVPLGPQGGTAPVPQAGSGNNTNTDGAGDSGTGGGSMPSNRGSLQIEWTW